jgi:hypothetical protein
MIELTCIGVRGLKVESFQYTYWWKINLWDTVAHLCQPQVTLTKCLYCFSATLGQQRWEDPWTYHEGQTLEGFSLNWSKKVRGRTDVLQSWNWESGRDDSWWQSVFISNSLSMCILSLRTAVQVWVYNPHLISLPVQAMRYFCLRKVTTLKIDWEKKMSRL